MYWLNIYDFDNHLFATKFPTPLVKDGIEPNKVARTSSMHSAQGQRLEGCQNL